MDVSGAEFKTGSIEEETILELRVDRETCETVHTRLVRWIEENLDRVLGAGMSCPSMGEYDDDLAWADLSDGAVQVNIPASTISLVFWNTPEGDDRLDGGHPHWRSPHPHLWMEAVPRLRRVLSGRLD